eukprot:CAMPEP_0172644646 /NCGR_PEP_ID=MMETSP1068-20121228/239319_1 /TAXON_ID=35684 /ORGANISM="Pseudopedinella elastica, Strain CCMP716" /LENGTH=201 /DNA_ID=CAMNT_0013458851 /DNA_START=229 /DNA_END=834 /DNA_ORIENTATION=-
MAPVSTFLGVMVLILEASSVTSLVPSVCFAPTKRSAGIIFLQPRNLRDPMSEGQAMSAVAYRGRTIIRSGPRDGPSDADYEQEKATKLILSLLIDLVGYSSYLLPALGEAGDVAWAPISAGLIQYLYGNGLLSAFGFAEELLPGLDFIPTATIGWFITYYGEGGNDDSSGPSGSAGSRAPTDSSRPPSKLLASPDERIIDI